MMTQTVPWESEKYLTTLEDIAGYLDAVLEEGDPQMLSHALGIVARSEGMTLVARETGLSREALYRSLSVAGNPELATVMKVLKALGLRLSVEKIAIEKTDDGASVAAE